VFNWLLNQSINFFFTAEAKKLGYALGVAQTELQESCDGDMKVNVLLHLAAVVCPIAISEI